ncbi:MAG: hypothetical protein AAFO94_21600, partial [Bacteroidota bacterium]
IKELRRLQSDANMTQQEESNYFLHNSPDKILRRIGRVYISDDRCLVLGDHKLSLNEKREAALLDKLPHESVAPRIKLILASRESNHIFNFKDGSKVTIFSAGYALLQSSSPDIAAIFISMIVDRPLAMATRKSFAGNHHFLPYQHALLEVRVEEFFRFHIQKFVDHILQSQ